MNEEYNKNLKKIEKIKKYFKKDKTYLELSLLDYDGFYFYITINYIKKAKSYKLSWFDLNIIDENKIDKYINYEYINENLINDITNYCFSYFIKEKNDNLNKKDLVKLNINIKTKNNEKVNLNFNKYLPKSQSYLSDLFVIIFQNLPKKLENFLYELLAEVTGTKEKYEYKKELSFDLFNENLDKLFSSKILERGENYYLENKVKYLEKIEDKYFSIVEGEEKYVVIIKYNEEEKLTQVYCSCPCEFYCKHICASILAIRNNKYNRFFKIMFANSNENLLEVVENFNYYLCLGISHGCFEIINNGGIELVPIIENDICNWKVLEDSEDEILTKQINDYIDNYN